MKRLVVLLILSVTACQGNLDVSEPAQDEPPLEHGELDYRGEGHAENSTLEEPIRPARSFQGVSLMLTSSSPEGRYQVQFEDGTWSDWRDLDYDWHYRKFQNHYIALERPAQALRLDYDAASAEFTRLEFHAESMGEVDPHDDSLVDFVLGVIDEIFATGLSRPGRWDLPSTTERAGTSSSVGYDSAPRWSRRNCSGSLRPGARALGDYLVDNFVGARYFQGYNCRQIRGSSSMSMHGTGRAIDVFVPLDRGRADNDLGDEIANFLIENSEALGVQLIIWDRTIWQAGRSDRYYGGAHPHHDHLHIELTRAAASRSRVSVNRTPTTPTAWVGEPCTVDSDCDFSSGGAQAFCYDYEGGGFCSLPCEGLCPDRPGEAYTFCVASDTQGTGVCASYSATQNSFCGDIPGAEQREMTRYVGSSSLAARRRTVCMPPSTVMPLAEPAWVGTPCTEDSQCNFVADGERGFCYENSVGQGFCGLSCEGLCPDRDGEAPTFCIEATGGVGVCTSYSAAQNRWCAEIPGATAQSRARFVGTSNTVSRVRTVCAH